MTNEDNRICQSQRNKIQKKEGERAGERGKKETREKEEILFQIENGNVFFVKEEMKRLEKGRLLASCLLLVRGASPPFENS